MQSIASTFAKVSTASNFENTKKTITEREWSFATVFLHFPEFVRYVFDRSGYDSENVDFYFGGVKALIDVYLSDKEKGASQSENGKKKISALLSNGQPLVVTENEKDGKPTLIFSYDGQLFDSGDEGIYTTLDAWMLLLLCKIQQDADFRAALKNNQKDYRVSLFSEIKNADFSNVDFSTLEPAEGLNLSGLHLQSPNFTGATINQSNDITTKKPFNRPGFDIKITDGEFAGANLAGDWSRTLFDNAKNKAKDFPTRTAATGRGLNRQNEDYIPTMIPFSLPAKPATSAQKQAVAKPTSPTPIAANVTAPNGPDLTKIKIFNESSLNNLLDSSELSPLAIFNRVHRELANREAPQAEKTVLQDWYMNQQPAK